MSPGGELVEKHVVAGPCMNRSGKFQQLKRPKLQCRRFGFYPRWPEMGTFFPFFGGQNGTPTQKEGDII